MLIKIVNGQAEESCSIQTANEQLHQTSQ